MMDIAIETPAFQGRGLAVRPASWFRGPLVVVDGETVKGRRSRFLVRDNHGQEVTIRLISNHIDPIPRVMVGEQTITLARPLEWYEYVWSGLPILMALHGGALGGICGFVALQKSAGVFRGEDGKAKKFLITGLISLGAVVVYLLLAVIFLAIMRRVRP
jgi:hypothetical protein